MIIPPPERPTAFPHPIPGPRRSTTTQKVLRVAGWSQGLAKASRSELGAVARIHTGRGLRALAGPMIPVVIGLILITIEGCCETFSSAPPESQDEPAGEAHAPAVRGDASAREVLAIDAALGTEGELRRVDVGRVVFDREASPPLGLSLELPPGVASVHLQIDAAVEPSWAYAFVAALDGSWLLGPPGEGTVRASASRGLPFAGGWPDRPGPVAPGAYRVSPAVDDSLHGQELTVTAWLRPGPPPPAGRLHVEFLLARDCGLQGAGAALDPRVDAFVETLRGALAAAHIELVVDGWIDATGVPRGAVSGPQRVWEVLRATPPGRRRSLPIVVVDTVVLDLPTSEGVAAHVPGPAWAWGRTQAGVVVGSDWILAGDAVRAAALVGHEIGHFLGLQHVSEPGGLQHDPFDDTPVGCDARRCWPTGLMDAQLSGRLNLSEQQGAVMRLHPLVRAETAGEPPAPAP